MIKVLLMMAGLLFASNVLAFDKIYENSMVDMEDLIIKENGVKINNFSFAEQDAFMVTGLVNVVVSFSAKNNNEVPKHFSAMIVGKSGDNILWAVSAEPMMSTLSPKSTDTINGSSYISPNGLKQTDSIWLRIVGDI